MATFTGANRDEWIGPHNLLGAAEFSVYQHGEVVGSLKEAQDSGEEFTVAWYFSPSNAEEDAGMTAKGMLSKLYMNDGSDGPNATSYTKILGSFYAMRRAAIGNGDVSDSKRGRYIFAMVG